MKVVIHSSPTLKHQLEHARAMQMGLGRHGIDAEIELDSLTAEADISICWGWKRGKQLAPRRPVLVMERGYIGDRMKWTSLGWNGLNGRADFHLPEKVDRRRFDYNFGDLMRPWRISGGEYVVVMGQVPGDSQLSGLNFNEWAAFVIDKLRGKTAMEIVFRPHPFTPDERPGNARVIWGTLADVLGKAAAVVTYNSNSGVDAVLAGVPTVAVDAGSMAWPVADHELTAEPQIHVRNEWAYRLAWCQWTFGEIADGTAWEHVRH